MNYKQFYLNQRDKGFRIYGNLIPKKVFEDVMGITTDIVCVCPYDKGFIQFLSNKSYFNSFDFLDNEVSTISFIEDCCITYINKHKKNIKGIRKNKNAYKKILRTVLEIHKNKK